MMMMNFIPDDLSPLLNQNNHLKFGHWSTLCQSTHAHFDRLI